MAVTFLPWTRRTIGPAMGVAMAGQVSRLIECIARALESSPCADFDEFAARILPLAQADCDVVIVDVEPDSSPPGVIIATASGWLVLVDRVGIIAGKVDATEPSRGPRPSPRTAVQRKFARPVLPYRGTAGRNTTH